MKNLTLLLFAAALVSVSCQRIPPSVSIPGYDQKEATEEKAAHRTLGASENPPTYFPGKKSE